MNMDILAKSFSGITKRHLFSALFMVFSVFLFSALFFMDNSVFADYQTTGRVYPESDVSTQFNGCSGGSCGSGHWAVLDEVSYDFTDYIYDDNGGGGEIEEFEMTSVAGTSQVNEVRVNFRAYSEGGCSGACDEIDVNIFIGGSYRGVQSITLPTTDQQYTLTWVGPYGSDGDLRVQLVRQINVSADTVRVLRLYADVDYVQSNSPPSVTGVVTDPVGPNPTVTQGENITFEIDWTDPEGNSARAIVCKTNAVVGGSTPGCPGDAWIGPSNISNDEANSIILTYKTTSNDIGVNDFYVFVCDSPGGECSSTVLGTTNGTFTVDAITADLYGWAWSSNIGWISFDAQDCDTDENGFVDSGLCEGDNTTDVVFDYGVFLDTPTGDLSGYAWSSNIGWITFNRADAGNPPAPPFDGGSGPIARLEGQNLRGWARALSNGGGWDGWIRFDEDTSGGAPAYGGVTFDGSIEAFEGWAWGDEVMGWMSFNSTTDTTSTESYAVRSTSFNAAPSVTNLNISFSASSGPVCVSQMRLSWDFGDSEDGDICTGDLCGYRIQVSTLPDIWVPSGPGGIIQFDSGIVRSGAEERFVTIANPATHEFDDLVADGDGTLEFSTNYYWRVQVYDSEGEFSDWVVYQDDTIPAESFTTSLHPYPEPDFSWECFESDGVTPKPDCAVPTQIHFSDLTTFDAGAGAQNWDWELPLNPPPTMTCINPGCESEQNPQVEITDAGLYIVRLTATDGALAADVNSGAGQCSIDKIVVGQYPLPEEFKEITPVSLFKNIIFGFTSRLSTPTSRNFSDIIKKGEGFLLSFNL
ncbi:MAG: hypothetical protein WDZ40_01410 [Candidatus Spechtbacterales bacterium]